MKLSSTKEDSSCSNKKLQPITADLVMSLRLEGRRDDADELVKAHIRDMKKAGKQAIHELRHKDYIIKKIILICTQLYCTRPAVKGIHMCEHHQEILNKSRRKNYWRMKEMDEGKEGMNLGKAFAEMQKKAIKYDNMRGRYLEHATKLKEIVKELNCVIKELDPYASVGEKRFSGIDFDKIIAELYDKALHGTEIGCEMVEKAYPELTEKKSNYVMTRLQKEHPKLMKRKEGRFIYLYVQKDI